MGQLQERQQTVGMTKMLPFSSCESRCYFRE